MIVTAQVLQQDKISTLIQRLSVPGQAIAVWHASRPCRLAYPEAYTVKKITEFTESCLAQASCKHWHDISHRSCVQSCVEQGYQWMLLS